jgi:hypothetical protein
MKLAQDARPRYAVKIPFTEPEEKRFRDYLKGHGLMAGPFLRILALNTMELLSDPGLPEYKEESRR